MLNGWVLAGGRSTRFGSDKALWRVDGVPLVVRTAAVLAAAGLRAGVVGKAPRGLDLPERLEAEAGYHPLFGVAAALDLGPALVVPCDLVDLRVEQVRALVDAFDHHPAGVVALGQPLLACFAADRAGLARSLAADGAPVRRFVEGVPTVDLGPVTNLNRPPSGG